MKELLEELKFQLGELHYETIDKDDFIQAIEEIYWEFRKKRREQRKR